MKRKNEPLSLSRRVAGSVIMGWLFGFLSLITIAGLAVYGPPNNAGAWVSYVYAICALVIFGVFEDAEEVRSVFLAYYAGGLIAAYLTVLMCLNEQAPVYSNPLRRTLIFALVGFPLAKLLAIVLNRYTYKALMGLYKLLQRLRQLRKPSLLAI